MLNQKVKLLKLKKLLSLKNKIVNIGIRLNPNIDAKTLKQISTGKKENKFGVDEKTFFELVKYLRGSKNINLKCLSVHIGSQILNHKPYEKMLRVVDKVIKKSNHSFEFIDSWLWTILYFSIDYKKYNIKLKIFKKS